jgi:hypothetical protein
MRCAVDGKRMANGFVGTGPKVEGKIDGLVSDFVSGCQIADADILDAVDAVSGIDPYFFPVSFRYFIGYNFHTEFTSIEDVASNFYWIKEHPVFPDIKSGKCLLVFLDFWEAYYNQIDGDGVRPNFSFTKLFDTLVRYFDINPKHVLFVDGDEKNNSKPAGGMRFASDVGFFEWMMIRLLNQCTLNLPEIHFEPTHPTNKPKRFLSYSRHWNQYRQCLTFELFLRNLNEQGLISLSRCTYAGQIGWNEARLLKTNLPFWDNGIFNSANIDSKISDFTAKLPLLIDTHLNDNLANTLCYNHYYETDISIVNETHVSPKVLFLTEKIWKTIYAKHPFIIMGNPGSIALLNQLGYKTFSPFIDESYDAVENLTDRKNLLLKEIEKICEMSDVVRLEFTRNIQSVLDHNFKHLIARVNNFKFNVSSAAIEQALLENNQ